MCYASFIILHTFELGIRLQYLYVTAIGGNSKSKLAYWSLYYNLQNAMVNISQVSWVHRNNRYITHNLGSKCTLGD